MWSDPPNTDVLVNIYNYRYSEDDSLNRRVAVALQRYMERITGEQGFDVVPPEAEADPRSRTRERPATWVIRGLTPAGVASATARRVWSFNELSFFTTPRTTRMPSWICMLEGYLTEDTTKIRNSIIRVLEEHDMRTWIAHMVMANPEFRGRPVGDAVDAVIRSTRIEILQMGNGNYLANVFIRPPTRIIREWR